MKKQLLLLLLFLAGFRCLAHDDSTRSVIYTSAIGLSHYLPAHMHVLIDTAGKLKAENIADSMFSHVDELPGKKVRKQNLILHYTYLQFFIKNDEATEQSFYFTPGVFGKELSLYTKPDTAAKWQRVDDDAPNTDELAYRRFSVPAGASIKLLARVRFAKTNVVILKPYLIRESILHYYLNQQHSNSFGLDIITYTIAGVLLMMVLFSFVSFLQNKKREFLHYCVYAFSMGLLLFLKALLYRSSTAFNFFYEEYIDFALLIIGFIFYISFTRRFLNSPQRFPLLDKFLVGSQWLLVLCIMMFTVVYFTNSSYLWLSQIENTGKLFIIALGIVYVVLGLFQRDRLMNYLLAGNIANLLMGAISQYIILVPSTSIVPATGLLRQSLFFFELGILLELILFLAGLVYKNKIELIEKVKMDEALKSQQEKQQYEQQILVLKAQQDERTRISADMHDELGSGVTAIRLLSEIALSKPDKHPQEEISRISENANELMAKMNGIIWSMNPGHDTIDGLITYVRSYTSEYLDAFGIDYHMLRPQPGLQQEISGVKRRNLFLVIKECLNNIVKHAGATHVQMNIEVQEYFKVTITDNGKGIEAAKQNQFGNGLANMQRRMENINGQFTLQTEPGVGTTITLTVPISG